MKNLLCEGIARLQAHQVEEPRLDAELLLAEACGTSRATLRAHLDDPIGAEVAHRFHALIERRARHEPMAYILGHKEFFGLDLLVDRRVLIPRPETELLVEQALEWICARWDGSSTPVPTSRVELRSCQVIDVGTGSGAMAIAMAANLSATLNPHRNPLTLRKSPLWGYIPPMRKSPLRGYIPQGRQGKPSTKSVDRGGSGLPCAGFIARGRELALPPLCGLYRTGEGTSTPSPVRALPRGGGLGWGFTLIAADISADALAVARANAVHHHLGEQIQFIQSDLLANLETRADLIVANLPYISRMEWRELAPDIADYEPRLALDGGLDGLDCFREFFAQAPTHLVPGGAIMLEVGWTQAAAVRALARAALPQATVEVIHDGAGLERVVKLTTHLDLRSPT